MPTLATFLHDVLFEGRISLHAPADEDDADARTVLRQAHRAAALALAGPALTFDEETALAAGRVLMHAAWYFLNPHLPIASPDTTLRMPSAPTTPEQHLAADLLLRFAPALYRRARAMMQEDVLAGELERLLRQWPLSGVLADIVEPPLTAVDLGGHPGLSFLYAERLAEHERPGWFPSGRGMQYVELDWQQHGKQVAVLPALQDVAQEIREKETLSV
jgi:hypothetical protein